MEMVSSFISSASVNTVASTPRPMHDKDRPNIGKNRNKLKIDLIITVRYNPIFANLLKYKIEDNYVIEWGSLESYPNFEDHPIFNCWNKRNDDFYIYKTGKAVQEVKIIKNDDDDDDDWTVKPLGKMGSGVGL